MFLNLILNKISDKKGETGAREIIESIAVDIASSIGMNIEKNNPPHELERLLEVINDASNQLGFASCMGRDEKGIPF